MIVEGGVWNRRKQWHKLCAVRWKIMNQPQEARRFVYKRDRGACAVCGEVTDGWEVDHIVPLKHTSRPEHWQLGNLQTLCHKHHVEKTRADRERYP